MTKNIVKTIFFLGMAAIELQASDNSGLLKELEDFGNRLEEIAKQACQKRGREMLVEELYKESFAINIIHDCKNNIGTVTLGAQKHELDASDAELSMSKFLVKKHTEEQVGPDEKYFFIRYNIFSLVNGEPVLLRCSSFGPVFKTK